MAISRIILKIVGSVLVVALLSVLGGLIGVYLGGNWWVNFRLFGVRGYEAVGLLGVFLGLFSGLALAWRFIFKPSGT